MQAAGAESGENQRAEDFNCNFRRAFLQSGFNKPGSRSFFISVDPVSIDWGDAV
jgi:hypothetical protein